jgi:hypothetical protein
VSAPAWLVDTSITRPSRLIGHQYQDGALRSVCGQGFRTQGRVMRPAVEADRSCQDCARKTAATIGGTRRQRGYARLAAAR